MKKFIRGLAILAVWFIPIVHCAYANDVVEVEKIVVTPYRYEETLEKTASSITIITPEDIENSGAEKVIDVLRPVEGVTIKDYYGNGATASVDIAGFGEQAPLNVLVLVDGRRVNGVDLSGVDWNQIPLDQIEKIEILRGGSSGVLYGDNASSGVINIITKKGAGKPRVSLQTELGSYDMNRQRISVEGGVAKKFSYLFSTSQDSTHGYRENTFNKNKDFNSNASYNITDTLSARFSSGFHASSYGMPSGLFQHHIDDHGRTWARYGEDHAKNKDYYFTLGGKSDFSNLGIFETDFSYRQKNTDSYFPTSKNNTRKNKIKTFGLTPKYTLSHTIADHENKIISGLDFYRVLFASTDFPYTDELTRRSYTNINKNSIGNYIQDEFSLLEKLSLINGYRYEAARYTFAYHDFTATNPDRDSKLSPSMSAYNSGLVYTYKEDSSAFFNSGKSFRFPQVDEFTGQNDALFHQFLNTNLKPQSSINYQVGVRHKFTDSLKGSLSLFKMKVKNYIYFNPTGGAWGFGENENYDKSVHEGAESSFEAKLNSKTTFFINHTFTKAYFNGGIYDKKEIPMVPHNKASVGLKFLLPKGFSWNILGNYVGKRYFINDQSNAVSQLNEYMLADTNLSWHKKDLTVTFGINNLFNKQYSEYGVYGSDSSNGFAMGQCFFPSPKRNFGLKVDYAF